MPRNNPLRTKTIDELALMYVIRTDDPTNTAKLYGPSTILDEMRSRIDRDTMLKTIEQAREMLKIIDS